MFSIYKQLREKTEHHPDAIPIEALDRSPLSYLRLVEQTEKGIRQLNSFGVTRNDRVAMVLSIGPEMATNFLTVASAATCAPLNPGVSTPKLLCFPF